MEQKPNPPYYGKVKNEDGTIDDFGDLIEIGKCEYLTDQHHWNFKTNKEYEFYHVLKQGNIYVYTVFGEDIGIQLIPAHFFTNFTKKS